MNGNRLLALLGALLLLGYVGLFVLLESPTLWVYPALVQGRWPAVFEPLLALFPEAWTTAGRASEIGLLNSFLYFALLAWLFGMYLFALKWAFRPGIATERAAHRALRIIVGFAGAAMLVLLFVRGMLSTDIINYAWYGRIFGVFGGNPYIDVASDYAQRDVGNWLQYGIWQDIPSVYGPVWVMFAGAIAWVAQAVRGDDIVAHLLGHRLLYDAAHLVNTWLVWRVAELAIARYWRRPNLPEGVTPESWRMSARIGVTLAYAWNPLLIIETGVSGHNDALLVTGALAALWLHLAGRWRFAVLALALASLVKFSALLFLLSYIWLLLWQGRAPGGGDEEPDAASIKSGLWRVAQAGLIAALAWVVCFAPFWGGPATLEALSKNPGATGYNHSLGKILVFKATEGLGALASSLGWQPARNWDVNSLRAAFDPYVRWGLTLAAVIASIGVLWRAHSFRKALPAWGWVMFIHLTVGAFWFWPWYVSWLLVPALPVGPGRLWNAALILCASSMTLYALFPRGAGPLDSLVGWTGLVIMLPPLLYALFSRKPALVYWSLEKSAS